MVCGIACWIKQTSRKTTTNSIVFNCWKKTAVRDIISGVIGAEVRRNRWYLCFYFEKSIFFIYFNEKITKQYIYIIVGANGQSSQLPFTNLDKAKTAFKKKFRDKTRNAWDERGSFTKYAGKYDLVHLSYGGDERHVIFVFCCWFVKNIIFCFVFE